MVGDQHHPGGSVLQVGLDLDPERCQQCPRPTRLERQTPALGTAREE